MSNYSFEEWPDGWITAAEKIQSTDTVVEVSDNEITLLD